MASSTLQVTPTVTSTITFNKTNAETATILEWFISDYASPMPEGLTVLEQNNWKLAQAHRKMLDYVVRDARRLRVEQLRAAQASIEDQANQETAL